MEKVIGIIRNECGTITGLVMFDLEQRRKYLIEPCKNAETLFGSYPLYNEKFEVIGNKGLIILEKHMEAVKLITCAGLFVEDGVENQIIAKTERLNMRIVNAAILTNQNDEKFIYIV